VDGVRGDGRRACRRARSKMGRILMIDFHVF